MTDNSQAQESGRVARWDQIRREQLSNAISLILSFAVAALGFETTLFLGEKFPTYSGCERGFFIHSFFVAGLSIVFGIAATLCRLCDFRLTARIVRKDQKSSPDKTLSNQWLRQARQRARTFGTATWVLFWLQICSFLVAIVLAGVAVATIASSAA